MKKFLFLFSFFLLFTLSLSLPNSTSAACYTWSDPPSLEFQRCSMSIVSDPIDPTALICPGLNPAVCCNSGTPCPDIQPPTPTLPAPPADEGCASVFTSPNPGPTGSTFTINGVACTSATVNQYEIKLFGIVSGVEQLLWSTQVSVGNTPSDFSVTIPASVALTPGYYPIQVFEVGAITRHVVCGADICDHQLIVTTAGALVCCDVDPNNCTIVNITTDTCPHECPANCTSGPCMCLRQSPPPSTTGAIYCDASGSPSTIPSDRMYTAIGCIAFETQALIITLLSWAIGISGGIALLLIAIASFQIATATGDPKRLTAGQELLFSALAGLTLISLAVVLLNFIGVSVLGLDSLGFQTP